MRIGVEYNQAPQRDLTFWEKYQIAEIAAQYPALTLKVLFRRKVGLRRAEPSHIFVMAAILFAIGYTAYREGSSPGGLMVFAVAVAIAGYWQQFSRWKELRAGTPPAWHTYSDGVSPLEDAMVWYGKRKKEEGPSETPHLVSGLTATAPLPKAAAPEPEPPALQAAPTDPDTAPVTQSPAWLLTSKKWLLTNGTQALATIKRGIRHVCSAQWWLGESRIYRRLDPLVLYLIGLALVLPDKALGLWVMFAAVCLSISENLHWRHQLKAYLDWHDAQIDNVSMRGWSGKKGQHRPQPTRSRRLTHGLSTGIGQDIRARVEEQAAAMQKERLDERRAAWQADPARLPVLPAPDNRAK